MEKDKHIKEILNEDVARIELPGDFAEQVMAKIEAKEQAKLKPIIGIWGWRIIGALSLIVIGISIVFNLRNYTPETLEMTKSFNFINEHTIYPLIGLSVAALFVILDGLLRKKRISS